MAERASWRAASLSTLRSPSKADAAAQPDPDADGARLALVGRRVEVQQFRAALESVQAYGDPQVVGLRGVAGIGKSRLLEEFARLATLEGFECHVLTSLELGAGGRSQLPTELAQRLLGTGPQDGPTVLEARLAEASDVLAPPHTSSSSATSSARPADCWMLHWPQPHATRCASSC